MVLVNSNPAGNSRPPLFCIEITGVEFFEIIGADQPVYNLRFGVGSLPGSVLRLPMIEALATHYIEELRLVQPKGPYFLIGYSWGGLIAYEMAQQLTASGEVVELVGLVDTYLPVALKNSLGNRAARIISYSPSIFFERLKYKARTRLTKEWMRYNTKLALRKWRYGRTYYRPDSFDVETIYTVMRAYRRLPYSGRVILFKATETSALPYGFHKSPEIEWKRLVGHGLEIERLPCDHATILKNPYVAQIARRVRAAIDRAVERDRRTREEVREPAEHSAEAVASE